MEANTDPIVSSITSITLSSLSSFDMKEHKILIPTVASCIRLGQEKVPKCCFNFKMQKKLFWPKKCISRNNLGRAVLWNYGLHVGNLFIDVGTIWNFYCMKLHFKIKRNVKWKIIEKKTILSCELHEIFTLHIFTSQVFRIFITSWDVLCLSVCAV